MLLPAELKLFGIAHELFNPDPTKQQKKPTSHRKTIKTLDFFMGKIRGILFYSITFHIKSCSKLKLVSTALLVKFYNGFCILEIFRHCIVEVDE